MNAAELIARLRLVPPNAEIEVVNAFGESDEMRAVYQVDGTVVITDDSTYPGETL